MSDTKMSKREKRFQNILNTRKDMFSDEEIEFLQKNFRKVIPQEELLLLRDKVNVYTFENWVMTHESLGINDFMKSLYYAIQSDESQELLISTVFVLALEWSRGKGEKDGKQKNPHSFESVRTWYS